MAQNYMISDSRIVNLDEIQDIKDIILCGICFQVVTEEREPVECNNCHYKLFCSQCISGWAKTSYSCPYCHSFNSQFVDISPLLLNMIRGIRYSCQYQSKGCWETHSMKTLMKHEFQQENQRYFEMFKCSLCQRLLRNPQSCNTCKINYCKHCISNQLIQRNACPSCYQPNPTYSKISRNLMELLSKFKIYCKNKEQGCNEILLYEFVENHENTCKQCLNCKVKCLKCEQLILIEDQSSHQCQIKLNQVQDAIYVAPVLEALDEPLINNLGDNDNQNEQYQDQRQRMSYCKRIDNDTQIRAHLAFTIIYFIGTLIPFFSSIYTPINYVQTQNTKLILIIGGLLSAHHLLIIFGPLVSGFRFFHYNLRGRIIGNTVYRNVSQIIIQITFITILAINEVDTTIKGVTIGLSSLQILWNVIVIITINFNELSFY
ncbi:traf-type zinc finger family protein [Stylonychia lemnae]|uniref:Traf-type zinc finger family protein n=1 Tax=Stylonychia lemnae TaxID=5949 RepID=A0A078AUB0_STYLE|nr:traf-type zinc finger family protein [Stylonychia lemnae]|eukprot:CDW84428.1 traf-type zinc finger family protein [Stylonychia lemnae]